MKGGIMKSKLVVSIVLVLVMAVVGIGLTGCDANSTVSAQQQPVNVNVNGQQGIWVSGQGKVTVNPDIAVVNLGVQTHASTVAEAQSQASTAMDKVIAALTSSGVDKKDIQTQYFNIQQLTKYDNFNQTNTISGYQVNNMVNVKIRAIDKVGQFIDAVANSAGDNIRINGVNFTVEQPEQYYAQARQLAMNDAKAKAQDLARLSGVTLGKVTYVAESIYSQYQPYPYYNGPMAMDSRAAAVAVPAPPMNPGQSDVILNVQVSYSIQ